MLSSRTRTGGPSSAAIRRVAPMPSSSGIRTSISTTSGRSRSASATPAAPSAASPTISRSGTVSSAIRRPARTSSKSSTSRTRTLTARSPPRAAAAAAPRPPTRRRRRARRDLAAVDAQPLAHADQAVAAARELRARAAVAAVGDVHGELVAGPVEADVRRRAAGVLDRVGQRLLHDAVDGELGAGAERAALAADLERHRQARGARALDELREPVERRRRRAVGRGLEHAEQYVHLGQRVGAGDADARRRLLRPLRVAGEDPPRAAGLHDHHADAVRDHVVHLARDPAALAGDRLLRLVLAPLGGERRGLVELGGAAGAGADGAAADPAQHDDRSPGSRRSRPGGSDRAARR